MEKFQKVFYNILTKEYNFYIRDYYGNYSNSSKWIAIRDFGDFIVGVIITSDIEEDINFLEATNYLKGAFNKPHILNSVVLVSGDYISSGGSDGLKNKLIFSITNKQIIYSDKNTKPLEEILKYIIKIEGESKGDIKRYKFTYMLIAINVFIYIITSIMSQNLFFIDKDILIKLGAKVNILINNGEVWRFLTAIFLHGGIIHLGFNMIALKLIGVQVEKIYGWKRYCYIYFLSGLGGTVLSYIFQANTISVGASGAIFGLLGAMLVFGFKQRKNIGKEYMINIIQVIAINIILGLSIAGIDNYGHIGGLITGVIISFIISRHKLSKGY